MDRCIRCCGEHPELVGGFCPSCNKKVKETQYKTRNPGEYSCDECKECGCSCTCEDSSNWKKKKKNV